MKNISRISHIWITLAILLVSCEKPNIIEDSKLLSYLYSNGLDTLIIQNSKYCLKTQLYRDFFPGGPIPRKTPLIAYITLISLDSSAIPDNIDISKLYVINDQQIWISNPADDIQPLIPVANILNKVSNDGPEWPTGIYVDVVARILNNKTMNEYLLIARHQKIEREE